MDSGARLRAGSQAAQEPPSYIAPNGHNLQCSPPISGAGFHPTPFHPGDSQGGALSCAAGELEFTPLGDTAFVRASVSPSMEKHSWQWEGSPGCSPLLVQPALLSPVSAEAAGAACMLGASSEPRGTEAGNGLFLPSALD